MFKYDRKAMYINSTVRSSGTNEDFTIITTGDTLDNVPKSVKLLNASIPHTWNNVQVGSNNFTFIDHLLVSHTVVIPAGNYTGTTLATAIQTAMNVPGPDTYTVTFSATTFKMTFTTSGATMGLDFATSPGLATLLGFVAGTVYGPSASITSPNVVNIVKYLEIMICSDLVTGSDNGVIPLTPNAPILDLAILAAVPINACFGGLVCYSAHPELPFMPVTQSPFSKIPGPNDNEPQSVRFYLLWSDATPVDLNGASWTAEIVFDFNE
jgi:hypothetical protein